MIAKLNFQEEINEKLGSIDETIQGQVEVVWRCVKTAPPEAA